MSINMMTGIIALALIFVQMLLFVLTELLISTKEV